MAENLRTTKYNDGSSIPFENDNVSWLNLTTAAYCWYDNDISKKDIYGALYNWYAVNRGNLCPAGWHIPTDQEWTVLTAYLGGGSVAGGKLKETGTAHWNPNSDATNESGFTALPDGWRGPYGFDSALDWGFWWSSTENDATTAWHIILFTYDSTVNKPSNDKKNGFSVRCIKDE
jgi:uncharacterized protein (TIGR02145 family)